MSALFYNQILKLKYLSYPIFVHTYAYWFRSWDIWFTLFWLQNNIVLPKYEVESDSIKLHLLFEFSHE